MRPGKGNWGPTQMLRYAIEELGLDPGRTKEGHRETIVKLMRKETSYMKSRDNPKFFEAE